MPLEEVLEAVPELRDAQSVEPLTGGLTNTNYKVTSPSGCFVVRISGKDTSLLAIDRENEVHNTVAAAETGVGAPFVAALPEHDALVLGFLEGEVMDAEKLRRGDRLARDRGRVPAPPRRPPLPPRLRHVRDPAALPRDRPRARLPPPRPVRGRSSRRSASSSARCACARSQTVPCNNDLLAENFIDVGGEMRLIDYEYSGNNEPSFELGNVWSESNLSLEQLEELVAHYYGRPLRNKVARARLWGLMSKYGWTLWGSIQAGISDLDFDFWGWAMEKYERAVEELDGPEFERLLLDVQRTD